MTMNRRDFLKVSTGASGSLILAVSVPGCASVQTGYQPETGEWKPDIWLELTRDDEIIFTLARVEMGQGTYTGLTTLVAEELDVEPGRIKVKFAPVAPEYRNPLFGLQLTGGSTSLASSWVPLRVAGAQARQMLIMAAARVWEVDADQCTTQDGRVVHPNGVDSLRYGQLVELADREVIRGNVPLKPRSEWKYIGRKGGKLDARAKATGTAVYGMDVELPGMVYAVMTRSPRYGGKASSFNRDEVIGMPGVTDAFITERGVALVAQRYWQARKAQQKLRVEWDLSDALDTNTEAVFDSYRQAASKDPGVKERSEGNVEKAAERAKQVVEAEYEQPYLAHATMEPMNATAWYRDGGMDVWAPTQAPDLGRIAAARHTDLSPGKITIHTTFLGGGFGRRLTQDYIEEAAAVAYQLKVPVKLIWSREEDTRHGFLRPAMLHRMKGSLNDGELTGWHHQIVGPQVLDWYVRNAAPAQYPWAPKFLYDTLGRVGLMAEGIATPKDISAIEGAIEYPYQVPNVSVRHTHTDPGVPITWWRSVGYSHNGFAVETFMDELAHESGEDPLQFRMKMLDAEPRHREVLERAARLAGWGEAAPEGRARGLALFKSFGTYVAQVVEAGIENGEIRVYKVVCSVDCGQVVNPRIVEDQIEGGILFGLTAALYGEINFDNGEIRQSNFHDYRLMQMHQTPEVVVDIVDSEADPTGVGEPGVPPVIPALGNALFALTGKRQRRLPLTV
ncbi:MULTISPECIES: xanthine dehydrogenase family protein molybdopterin-binding subunit [unclassified Marinobacter]|uniref:xanthine dehydrogenase family protein molybdopterin-binding subunit n=1 Tax=unclassified Marinobacter TaxID=83889 RepID=UPI001268E19F|nr:MULTISPECIES: xanthine dehydrogenase family protein molybdopterin-binding subunit [unclassified Marinobacter]QFS87518.1 Isoquinoline 1-oxidoreductase subunit beta [Marinobacter sp. THAF197a]QFT51303.1 Isoquinoline 1-oxidoreductase subunit beta [Marinobacter sp. THAF39]